MCALIYLDVDAHVCVLHTVVDGVFLVGEDWTTTPSSAQIILGL